MKKSTLFFKVMVLLALLVPWTSWGQDVSTRSFGGSDDGKWKNPNLKRGEMTITLDASGNIVKVTNPAVVKNGTLELDLDDIRNLSDNWEFDTNKGWAIIDPSNELEKYFSIKVDDDELTIVKKRYGSAFTDVSKEFKIKVVNSGKHGTATGHILIKFKKETTDITNNTNISIDFSATGTEKTYDGTAVSVTVNDKDKEEPLEKDTDYTITISKDGKSVTEIKDAGIYTVEITGKGKYGGKKTATYTIKQKELTVTIKDQTIELPNGKVTTTLTTTGADATISAPDIIPGETVEFSGAIATASTANASKPGKYENGLIENSSSKITSKNGNYTVKTVTPGDLIVKYNVTDDNYERAFTVTTEGNGKYTYDNKEHGATVTSKTEGLTDCLEIWYKEVDGEPTQEKPKHVGEYTIVIKKKADAKCEYITIPEAGITTDKKIVISAKEITVTGSVTVEQGATLKDSYNADELNLQASETGIEGLTLEFTGSVEPNENAKTDEVSEGIENAFTVQEEGGWTIDITADETYFKTGDITIKDINIKLVVTEKEVQWYDGEAKAEETVYVNEEGQLKYGEDEGYGSSVNITLKGISELAGWSFVLEENPEEDFDVLAVMSGDEVVMEGLSWATLITTDKVITGLQVSSENKNSIYESLTESKSVKVRLEKDGADGYLLITFKQGESTEEPGGDDEDMTWAENKKASITVYVDKSSGQPLKSEPAMDSKGFAIDLAKFEELEGEWSFATTDDNAIIDKDLSALYSFVVFDEDLLLEPKSEFNSESLSSVKVKIENGDNVGYLEINFKTITVIAEDDINKGGDDDNDDEQIDDDKITFVGEATGAKYVIYDGLPHGLGMLEVSVDGKALTLSEAKDEYSVTYEGLEGEPIDAGTYSATITFNEAMGYSGTVTLTNSVVIAQRPITLYFSFEEGILEGEEFVLGENVFIDVKEGSFAEGEKAEFDELIEKGIISAKFALGETQSDGTVEVKLVSFNYPAGEVSGYDLKYSNYDPKLLTGHVKEHGEGGTETELPDAGEAGEDGTIDYPGEGDSGVIVGDVDIIDEETGIGGSGINYRQYELKFCETDFFPNLNDYEVEGLKLFSRHNKFYTKANGSFTIWYEKDGVKNGEYGDYRIYISRNGADGDYSELKLDEVSDYFQIRNVNSDVWVRIYYGTGFPVANEEITATDARAYAQANKIVVITPEPTDVQVISMAGAVVATDQVTGQREFANLAEGVYIVRMGETVIKLQVRN